ncbi:MAG TPA: pyridine nucleotide-disulfide oxidoreductase, partial [Acetobacteraceae bacterium]|nr:pyridine nucleotide-disulfide oxidoreductase [Acetobacteraceae bacterium]
MDAVTPGAGFDPADLAGREALVRLDKRFLDRLHAEDTDLCGRLLAARAAPDTLDAKAEGELLVALGAHLEAFVADLFGIGDAVAAVAAATQRLDPIHACKRLFVQRQAVKKYADPSGFDGAALRAALEAAMGETLTEAAFATHVARWEHDQNTENLDVALRYAAWATLTVAGQERHRGGTLFHVPRKIDPQHLVPFETIERDGVTML